MSIEDENARLKAELEQWQAMHAPLLAETAASTEQWQGLVEKWRQERQETEALVHRMGERLAGYEAGRSGPRAH